MKSLISLTLILTLPIWSFADAGFNIRREKAPCFAVFTGIDKLNGYEFFKIPLSDRESDHIDSSN